MHAGHCYLQVKPDDVGKAACLVEEGMDIIYVVATRRDSSRDEEYSSLPSADQKHQMSDQMLWIKLMKVLFIHLLHTSA